MIQFDASGGRKSSSSQRLPVNPRRNKVAPEQRKRVATACNACNIRRIKCSGERPCHQCQSSSRECVYPAVVEKVSVSRTELEELRRKVKLYETTLQESVPGTTTSYDLLRPASVLTTNASQTPSFPDALEYLPITGFYPSQPRFLLPIAEQIDDVQASTQGRLLHDPDGHVRYLGETSGAAFLDYLKEFMRALIPLAYYGAKPGDGSAFLSSLGRYQTYDSRPLRTRKTDDLFLPPRSDMEAMLSELRFLIQDGSGKWASGGIYWWGDLSNLSDHPLLAKQAGLSFHEGRRIALFDMAFAVASQASTLNKPPIATYDHMSEFYYSRARRILGDPLSATLCTSDDVPVLTLMGFYLIEMNRRDAAYMCISNAMRLSVMHGLHRGLHPECEKRCFWTLFILDRWLSCLLGRPPSIMDDAIKLPLPCDVPDMPPAAGLIAHLELSRISGHIVCDTYGISPTAPVLGPLEKLEKTLEMLEQWRSDLPPRLQLYDASLSDDPACCLLHMGYNQLVILTIRPIFLSAIKKTLAERFMTQQSSLESHPQIANIRKCINAAELNIRLARHILDLNHPRKLLQSGLHFIFNAALCLVLQELVTPTTQVSRRRSIYERDFDFVIARFDEESAMGSNYGKDCASVLRDLGALVYRLRAAITSLEFPQLSNDLGDSSSTFMQNQTMLEDLPAWTQDTNSKVLPEHVQVGQGHVLYDELVTWMNSTWPQPYDRRFM